MPIEQSKRQGVERFGGPDHRTQIRPAVSCKNRARSTKKREAMQRASSRIPEGAKPWAGERVASEIESEIGQAGASLFCASLIGPSTVKPLHRRGCCRKRCLCPDLLSYNRRCSLRSRRTPKLGNGLSMDDWRSGRATEWLEPITNESRDSRAWI